MSRVRPLPGQCLIRILPPETQSAGGIAFPQRTLSPEEVQERNHSPEPPPPEMAVVEAVTWGKLKNGLAVPPPFPPGSTVLVREGTGQRLSRDIGERLKLVRTSDILAVLSEA